MRSRQIQRQLASFASAADRRNRPMAVLVVAGLVLLAGTLYAIATFSSMRSQGSRLATAQRTNDRVETLITSIAAERASRPDYAAMFPQKIFYSQNLVDAAREVWPEKEWLFEQLGTEKQARAVQLIENLTRPGVQLRIRDEPLEQVLELVDRVLNGPEEKFGRTFLATIDLRPMPGDETWLTTIDLDRYEFRAPR